MAVVVALLAWWVATGAVLCTVTHGGQRLGYGLTTWATAPVAGFGLWAAWASAGVESPAMAYLGFAGALALWGWLELAFLAGVIAGPNRARARHTGWRHFLDAWATLSHHEAALIAGLAALALIQADAPNPVAFYTFGVLYAARVSAKICVFLGVPNLNEDFLPPPLAHLASYFGRRRMNWAFPIGVTVLTFATGCFIERAIADPSGRTGFILLATLTALAVLEHWMMILPLPDGALWRWLMPKPKTLRGT